MSVTAFTQVCPHSAPSAGPFRARSWARLHPGAVELRSAPAQTVLSDAEDPLTAQTDEMVASGEGPCQAFAVHDVPGTAVYTRAVSRPFTLMGLPTLRLKVATSGGYGQLDARLWDVGPDGEQLLVTRGVYRLTANQSGRITWQLFGGGWRFERGHKLRLELLGSDPPFARPTSHPFTVRVSDLAVRLPTRERLSG